jgi:DNA-binding SARP family transcriptional activator
MLELLYTMTRAIWLSYKSFAVFFLLIAFGANGSYGQSYGLAFASYEIFQNQRTGIDLSQGKDLCFDSDFEISFDMSFLPNRQTYFGYIFRIIEDDSRNIDFATWPVRGQKHLNLVVGNRRSNISFDIDQKLLYGEWNKIRIKFDLRKDQIILYNGNSSFVESGVHLKKNSCYKILFGINNHKRFQTSDVPPMKIRNITIVQNHAIRYKWPLNEQSGNIAHEEISQNDAVVLNPRWVSAMHHQWHDADSLRFHGLASSAFNPEKEELYIITEDSLYTYHLNRENWTSTPYRDGKFVINKGTQSSYNSFDGNLYAFFPEQNFLAKYNFKTQTWDKRFKPVPSPRFWHYNPFFSKADTSLYLIAGYGYMQYHNDVQQFHLNSGSWNSVDPKGDFLMPRYLAALGSTSKGDTSYILGGYGSVSGQQIEDPKNTYDLVRYTVRDRRFKKLFELKTPGEDFVFANSMIIDDAAKSYYALAFSQLRHNSSLQLISGSLINPSYTIVSDSIPYRFHDTHSFADLFYGKSSKRFVAVTLFHSDDNQTTVKLYSLLGPPSEGGATGNIAGNKKIIYGLILIFALGIVGLLIYYAGRKKNKKPANPARGTETSPVKEIEVAPSEIQEMAEEVPYPVSEKNHYKNTIFLFGDLQVFDAQGNDLAKSLSPLLKEFFLILLIYNIRKGRGLSSEKLKEVLWNDMSTKSARNNRSVNLVKLKGVLDKIGPIHVTKSSGYWGIEIDYSQIYIDYNSYINLVRDKGRLDLQKIRCFSEITQRGSFLPNIEYEWLDQFKSEVTNGVIDTYLQFVQANKRADPELLLKISNYVFSFDPVNEEAMTIKCKALFALGKHSLAKSTFENFAKEYKLIYLEDYPKDFPTILE